MPAPTAALNRPVQLPNRFPVQGIKPDLPASSDGLIDAAFVNYLDQVTKEWLDNGGSQMRTEFEREIAAARAWLTPGPQGRTAAIRTSVACRSSRSPRLASGASTSSGRAPN
jgi:hypothetical protein